MHREYHPDRMGLGPPSHADHHHEHDHDHAAELRTLIATTVVVGLLLAADQVLAFGAPESRWPFGVSLALVAAVIGGGPGWGLPRRLAAACSRAHRGRSSRWRSRCVAAALLEVMVFRREAEVVNFITLLIGECLEAFTFGRAQKAIQALLEYRPKTARVVREGQEVEVAADSVAVGDLLVVRPGERIAADGTVSAGRSAVDQAILTGESLPVDKGEGDPVSAGTINQFGRLEIRVEKVGAQTMMGRVIRLLADQAQRRPLERTADRYAARFLPAVLTARGPRLLCWPTPPGSGAGSAAGRGRRST